MLIAVTETSLNNQDDAVRAEFSPDGYNLLDHARPCRQGGGTALLFRDLLAVKKEDGGLKVSFEFSEWTVQQASSHDRRVVIIYRLQSDSGDRRIPMNIFFTEFSDYLETVVLFKEHLVLVAAFNIHVDVPYDS